MVRAEARVLERPRRYDERARPERRRERFRQSRRQVRREEERVREDDGRAAPLRRFVEEVAPDERDARGGCLAPVGRERAPGRRAPGVVVASKWRGAPFRRFASPRRGTLRTTSAAPAPATPQGAGTQAPRGRALTGDSPKGSA